MKNKISASLQIRDKSDLRARCNQLEFTWRAAVKGQWKHTAWSGYKLHAEAYRKIIVEEGEALWQPEGQSLRACRVSPLNGTAIEIA
jgi:hypothetical protein